MFVVYIPVQSVYIPVRRNGVLISQKHAERTHFSFLHPAACKFACYMWEGYARSIGLVRYRSAPGRSAWTTEPKLYQLGAHDLRKTNNVTHVLHYNKGEINSLIRVSREREPGERNCHEGRPAIT